eukprot:TRINITY_DN15831_c0_g1_i2.p1 TRINITY_DN15831_c0_g1~~TRINITY_DN15831_c0_g1_i2.p1  ORF type:complete len:1063 (+),score=338.88 TRINITY_DN15831_c0_g1_i2:624-3812(+)
MPSSSGRLQACLLTTQLNGIVENDPNVGFQAALQSVEYSLDPECKHAVGFTFTQEKKIIDQLLNKKPGPQELPDAGSFACAEDFDKPVTLDAFNDMMMQVPAVRHAVVPQITIQWSGFNPPPRHRRLQGDLGYVDIRFVGNASYQVTCTPQGFYVNASKGKGDFNPVPAAKPCYSETLMGLIFQLNPRYKDKACELLKQRASLHPFETGPMVLPSLPAWMEPPEARYLPNGLTALRCGEGSPAVLDHHTPVRSWNDEIQRALELPYATIEERLLREKTLSRVHTEFIDFATRAAVTAADGQMAPLNPQDPPDAWIYLVNNVFISLSVDSRDQYADIGGDRAVRTMSKHDLHGIAAIRKAETSFSTVSTAIFDYKGRRIVCQTLVPGVLTQHADGKIASPQVHGVGDNDEYLQASPEVRSRLEELARSQFCEPHVMKDTYGAMVNVDVSSELKVLESCDGRHYLLECSKLAPRDMNFPDDPLAFIRLELKEEFIKSKRTGARYTELQKKIAEKAKEKGLSALEAHFLELDELAALEKDHPPVLFHCDRHSFTPGLTAVPPEDADSEKKSDAVLDELARFLKSKLPLVVDELVKQEVVDTECLSDVLHDHGINMRYLGEIATMLPRYADYAMRLCLTEMVARVAKHRLRKLMYEHSMEDLATPLAAAVSAIVWNGGVLAGTTSNAKKRKAEKKKQKRQQQKAAEVQDAASSAVDGANDVLEENAASPTEADTSSAKPVHPLAEANWIAQDIDSHFKYKLDANWRDIVDPFVLLRSVCCKIGLSIRQRMDYSKTSPLVAEDVQDLLPILHHHPPHYRIIEALLDTCQHDYPELMARSLHQALNHSNQVVGAVCTEAALCYQAIAKVLSPLSDIELAIQHQHKAMIITRRIYGATHGNMVPLLKSMGVMAHMSDRPEPALQYLRRALYLSRVLSGDCSFDLLFTLASFYHEVGHPDKALAVLAHTLTKAQKQQIDGKPTLPVATCYQHQAMILGQKGNHELAVETQKKALDLFTAVLGEESERSKEAATWYRYWISAAVESRRKQTAGPGKIDAQPKKKMTGGKRS